MNLVDSCGWLEYFADGPNADFYSGSQAKLGNEKKFKSYKQCLSLILLSSFGKRKILSVPISHQLRRGIEMRKCFNVKAIITVVSIFLYLGCTTNTNNKFENINRAAKAIEAALQVGVNYQKFGDLVQGFATEILILKNELKNDEENKLVTSYNEALYIFIDSSKVWKHKVESSSYKWIPKGRIFVEPELV